jgi:hypothetical protein
MSAANRKAPDAGMATNLHPGLLRQDERGACLLGVAIR